MSAITDTDYQQSIAAAVRAEFARKGCGTITQLARVIGMSRPTASSRWHGHTAYKSTELQTIAEFLGITAYDLNDSARKGDERSVSPAPGVARITPPREDAWAQPSRSRRRAS